MGSPPHQVEVSTNKIKQLPPLLALFRDARSNSYNHKNGKFPRDTQKIRDIISKVFQIWSDNSVLNFVETNYATDADIVISFESVNHPQIDPYPMDDPILAHAFRPGPGVAGDVHFRDDQEWDFDVTLADQPSGDRISFFAVALHELGHTLGLGHSSHPNAVMYEYYTSSTGVLSPDDIAGIQHIYGVPPDRQTESPTIIDDSEEIPDRCNSTSYDAIAMIHNALYIFKGRYMWNVNTSHIERNDAIEIRSKWRELPNNLTHIDAAIVNDDGKLLFFIGTDIYGFSATKFEFKSTLSTLGIDQHIRKIDAIFKWSYNNRTYIFSGDYYWRLDGKMVNRNYPTNINRSWRDVYDIDTAYATSDQLYFFKGQYFYEFDQRSRRIDRMNPQPAASNFMNCPGPKQLMKFETRFGDVVDVIDEGPAIVRPIDEKNIEQDDVDLPTETPDNPTKADDGGGAATHRLLISIMITSLAISRLPSISLYI